MCSLCLFEKEIMKLGAILFKQKVFGKNTMLHKCRFLILLHNPQELICRKTQQAKNQTNLSSSADIVLCHFLLFPKLKINLNVKILES